MRIAVVTGSRGDRGALEEVFVALQWSERHSPRWIDVSPGVSIRYPSDAACVAGMTCSTVAGDLASLPTDLVLLLGDRYEIAGAALGASIMNIPIAHLSGGDLTMGSQDDAYRHAITKLAHLHFPTNREAADRIAQMGEDPRRITVAGWPCLDRLARTVLPGRDETFAAIGLPAGHRTVLVSLHPGVGEETAQLAAATSEALRAILDLHGIAIVLIGPNADPGNDLIRDAWGRLASVSTCVVYRESVEQEQFWALMSHCDVLVGNSSAGYYEAPSMAIPVVDIGDRQKGRIRSSLQVHPFMDTIADAIRNILSGEWKPRLPTSNPYGDGRACQRILDKLDSLSDLRELLRKTWHEPYRAEEMVQC